MEKDDSQLTDFLKAKTAKIISSLDKDYSAERPIWDSPVFKLRFSNPASGTKYNLTNSLILASLAEDQGYQLPFYLTAKQGFDAGLKMAKGTKGDFVIHKFIKKRELTKTGDDGSKVPLLDKEGNPRLYITKHEKLSSVFNLSQFEGPTPERFLKQIGIEKKHATPAQVAVVLQSLMDTMPTPLTRNINGEGFHNYYSPSLDKINIAPKTYFKSDLHELSTLAHEIAHSYGHKDRKNRESLAKYSQDLKYRAFEELVANLAAQQFIKEFNLEIDESSRKEINQSFAANHDSYDFGWAAAGLKDQPEKVLEAASLADQTAGTMISAVKADLQKKLELNPSLDVPDILKAQVATKRENEERYAEKTKSKIKQKR